MTPTPQAVRLMRLLAMAMNGEQGEVNRTLQSVGYPFVETDPGARCRLWMHGKREVRTWTTGGGLEIDLYVCACGKRAWLAAPRESIGLVRIR